MEQKEKILKMISEIDKKKEDLKREEERIGREWKKLAVERMHQEEKLCRIIS